MSCCNDSLYVFSLRYDGCLKENRSKSGVVLTEIVEKFYL
ncbi:hypothetical protein FLCH110379_13060 [Flavobacterium chungbukense]|jgi:hypothetical protein